MAKKPADRFVSMGEFAARSSISWITASNQAGSVRRRCVRPKMQANDAPTSGERKLVEQLLALSSDEREIAPADPGADFWTKMRRVWARRECL